MANFLHSVLLGQIFPYLVVVSDVLYLVEVQIKPVAEEGYDFLGGSVRFMTIYIYFITYHTKVKGTSRFH